MKRSPNSSRGEAVIPSSSLLVFWPGDEPPLAEEIRLRLADRGLMIESSEPSSAEGALWNFWFLPHDHSEAHLLWCEAIEGDHLALLDSVHWRTAEQENSARQCRWLVGLEGPLRPYQPMVDYHQQLKLTETILADVAPVVFDASAILFRTPEDISHLTSSRTLPRTACLFSIHRLEEKNRGRGEPTYWVHTHGLERAGVPDLELFHVPERLLPAACELIDAVADLFVEFGTPDPEALFAIGDQLEVCWRPWQAMVTETAPLLGDRAVRDRESGHAGYRAVIVVPGQGSTGRKRWLPPLPLLEKLMESRTTLFKTSAESRRMADLARERWGSFGTLFFSQHARDWRFAVKLKFPLEEDPEHGEHLWFDCVSLQPGLIQARLVSQPAMLRNLAVGAVGWHKLEQLSDWRIFTPAGVYDPENADSLLE